MDRGSLLALMAPLDPRSPIIVGVGQRTHRPADGPVPQPLELAQDVVRAAARDAGRGGEALLSRAGCVSWVDTFSWPTGDPAALLAAALDLTPTETVRSPTGGNGPIMLLGDLAQAIADGRHDVGVVVGAEAITRLLAAQTAEEPTGFAVQEEGTQPTRVVGIDRDPAHPAELAAGLVAPLFVYPLVEHAVRAAAGRSRDDHQAWLGELWLRFADVARSNPLAWTRDPPATADEIATASPANRRVSDPYVKVMNANIAVDQAAALLVCSVGAAQSAGIDPSRWVFVEATAGAHDHWFVCERDRLDRSPALAACGAAVLHHAQIGIDDVELIDLYSCFPSAVQVAATELGIDLRDPARAPTVTGGLPFFGGPANDYVTHSLATLVERLRGRDPGAPAARGLATAVGWYLTKHATALLSSAAPAGAFAHHDVQDAVDAQPRRAIAGEVAASAPVEAHTAIFDRDGTPTMGIVTALLPDGSRTIAKSHDPAVVGPLVDEDPLGRTAVFDGTGAFGWT